MHSVHIMEYENINNEYICLYIYVIRTVPCPHSVLWDLNYFQAQQCNEKALLVNELQWYVMLPKFCCIVTKMSCHNHKRNIKNPWGRKAFSWSAIYVIRKHCPRCALNTGRPAQLPKEKTSLISHKDTIVSVPLFIY